ncbi:MAG: magnesium transporter CorA family protein [Actinomycetota bacterium]|nr:magnesium transporter CorA family protein [Actinomycetota bacterium]
MHVLTRIDRDQIEALRSRDEFFWLELHDPSQPDVEELAELFTLHPMAVKDLHSFGQRPKIDAYGDWVLLVFYGARLQDDSRIELVEVQLVVSGGYIVSIHRQPCPELDQLRDSFAQRPPPNESFVVYRVLDVLTDTYFPVLAALDDEIDDLENDVIEQPTDEQLQRLFRLKRDLVAMRKVVTPARDLFARAGDDIIDLPGLEPGTRDYFRDVYDHLIRISDLIDSYRDLLTGAMDVYLSTVSNRLNVVMKQLTIIATIFLPLTFVTGFFGQNFAWLVKSIDTLSTFLLYGIGGLVVAVVGLLAWFRRSGYI